MQQTDKYKLNLIEASDTFSPDPLNENARRLEEAIAAEAAAQDQARAADIAALDQRLQVFEAHKLVIGRAISDSTFMYLGFKPKVLVVQGANNAHVILFDGGSTTMGLSVRDDGFHHDGAFAACHFIAFV